MAENKRFLMMKQGGPCDVKSVPVPSIEADNEVIVKVKAVALQPVDWKQLDWGIMVEEWPKSIGLDGAGVVEQVGSAVTRFKPGDEVLGFFLGGPRAAAYQSYAAVAESLLAKKPLAMSFEDAASLSCGYITAFSGLYSNLKIQVPHLPNVAEKLEPRSFLVLGGSSSVGSSFIELVKIALPDSTILATSSTKHHKLLGTLGVAKSFDRSATAEEIRAATPNGKGVDVIFDAVDGVPQNREILGAFDPSGAKILADVFTVPGVFEGLSELLSLNKYKAPIPVTLVGQGLEFIAKGIDDLRAGVSGTKLVVSV